MSKDKDIILDGGVAARPGKRKKHLKVYHTLYESNYRDIPKTLRKIAKDIESGKYGNANEAVLVLDADKEMSFTLFGMGPQQSGIRSTLSLLDLGMGELRGMLYDQKIMKAMRLAEEQPPKDD